MKTTGPQGWFNRNKAWILMFFVGAMVALTAYDFTSGLPDDATAVLQEDGSYVVSYVIAAEDVPPLVLQAEELLTNEEVAQVAWEKHNDATGNAIKLAGYFFFVLILLLMIRAKVQGTKKDPPMGW